MTPISPDRATETGGKLLCSLTPSGRIEVRAGPPEGDSGLSAATRRRIVEAFDAGR